MAAEVWDGVPLATTAVVLGRWIVVSSLVVGGCFASHEDAEPDPEPGPEATAPDSGRPELRRPDSGVDPDPEPAPDPPDAGQDAGLHDGECNPWPGYDCPPGRQAWCSSHIYGRGRQTCMEDGRWGPCIESPVTLEEGVTDRPATECGCRFFYFNYDCCEDQEDRDCDGNPDCLIPEDWEAPACESHGTPCSYCDVHAECGGPDDMCLFGRDGYTFCSRDCSERECPEGWTCEEIGTRSGTVHQCVPPGGRCD